MTTSPRTALSKPIKFDEPLTQYAKAYFRERNRNRVYNMVMECFVHAKAADGLNKAEIAKRLNVSPALVNRWLGAPGNWTLDTVSDLLLAICGLEMNVSASKIVPTSRRNRVGPDWLAPKTEQSPSPEINSLTIRTETPSLSWPANPSPAKRGYIEITDRNNYRELEVVR